VSDAKRAEILRVREHVTSTISDIRRLLDDLRADRDGRTLDETSVQDLADRMTRRSEVKVTVNHRIDSKSVLHQLATDGTATEIHLMMREALLNVERHAHASHVSIDLSMIDDHVIVVVRDDGRGFDAELRGHGISGMRERAEWIGASLDIDSGIGGTAVTIRVPLEESST
jgi:signal transduction histidine kinase